MPTAEAVEIEVGAIPVRISNPEPGVFLGARRDQARPGQYYLAVSDGIVRALRERPCMLHRFPKGVDGEKIHQKRLPQGRRSGSRPSGAFPALRTEPRTNCA